MYYMMKIKPALNLFFRSQCSNMPCGIAQDIAQYECIVLSCCSVCSDKNKDVYHVQEISAKLLKIILVGNH